MCLRCDHRHLSLICGNYMEMQSICWHPMCHRRNAPQLGNTFQYTFLQYHTLTHHIAREIYKYPSKYAWKQQYIVKRIITTAPSFHKYFRANGIGLGDATWTKAVRDFGLRCCSAFAWYCACVLCCILWCFCIHISHYSWQTVETASEQQWLLHPFCWKIKWMNAFTLIFLLGQKET